MVFLSNFISMMAILLWVGGLVAFFADMPELGIALPLTVMQILTIDLGTDMLPALGLGTELPEKGVMDQPPRSQKEPLLNKRIAVKAFFWYGLLESITAMGAYFFVNILNGWPNVPLANSGIVYRQATTMTLAAIVFCQIGMVLNCRYFGISRNSTSGCRSCGYR